MRNPQAPLRIGTRASTLATTQASLVAAALGDAGISTVLVPLSTAGDRSSQPLHLIGGTGVFVAAVRQAVLDDRCDIAVHSLKDLPVDPAPGLVLAATPAREDVRDVLVARDGLTLDDLAPGAVVGTGSGRRAAYIRSRRPDLSVVGLRGNVDSRIGKVTSRELDGVILAAAGLARIGRLDAVTEFFDPLSAPPAPGQGALAIECRADDYAVIELLSKLDDPATRLAVTSERAVLSTLDAGCTAPIGAYAIADEATLAIQAVLWRDGDLPPLVARETWSHRRLDLMTAEQLGVTVAERLGMTVAERLGDAGGREYLDRIKATRSRRLRVGTPRAADGSPRWHEAISAAGAEPVDIDLLQTVPPRNPDELLDLVHGLDTGRYDALVLTSARTVAALAAAAANSRGLAAAQTEHQFITASVGPATTEAAQRADLRVDIALGVSGTAADLAAAVIDHLDTLSDAPADAPAADAAASGTVVASTVASDASAAGAAASDEPTATVSTSSHRRHIALPQSELSDGALAVALRDGGCVVDEIGAYTVRAHPMLAPELSAAGLDVVLLPSGSGVQAWTTLDPAHRSEVLVVCIGRSASTAAHTAALPVVATVSTPAVTEITRAVRDIHAVRDIGTAPGLRAVRDIRAMHDAHANERDAHTDQPASPGEGV